MNSRNASVKLLPAPIAHTGINGGNQTRVQPTLFLLLHAVLGIVLYQIPTLSTLHVYAVLALGVYWATTKSRIQAAYVAAYVVGAEVLWRMTGASFFWEGGKYAVALILFLSLIRGRKNSLPVNILFYFLLLLPSTVLTLSTLSLSAARDAISFNLSGPLALFVSAWFFSNLSINLRQLIEILISLVAPVFTTAIYALLSTLSSFEISWVNDSMFQTSGGFGPNQVSTIMGLGIVAAIIVLLIGDRVGFHRPILAAIVVVLFVQGLLTFSRGGILVASIVLTLVVFHVIHNRVVRIRLIVFSMIAIPLLVFAIIPVLNEFTRGFLEIRFTDSNLTNRDVILMEELRLFQENPLTGVGLGVGNTARGAAAHTEMTRLLAEHGLLGATSLVLLLVMMLQRYFAQGAFATRGIRFGWMLWALLVMTNAAMRLAAVSFIYGLAFARIELDDNAK